MEFSIDLIAAYIDIVERRGFIVGTLIFIGVVIGTFAFLKCYFTVVDINYTISKHTVKNSKNIIGKLNKFEKKTKYKIFKFIECEYTFKLNGNSRSQIFILPDSNKIPENKIDMGYSEKSDICRTLSNKMIADKDKIIVTIIPLVAIIIIPIIILCSLITMFRIV